MLEHYKTNFSIRILCTYEKDPLKIHKTSDVGSVPSAHFQFMYVI